MDAAYSDLHANIIVNTSLKAPNGTATAGRSEKRMYKVKAGDTLSKIAQQFYGKASEYNKIFQANREPAKRP